MLVRRPERVETFTAALIATVAGVLERTGIAPERLVLEVTETLLVKDAVRCGQTLQQLRDLGVQLALDDSAPATRRCPTCAACRWTR